MLASVVFTFAIAHDRWQAWVASGVALIAFLVVSWRVVVLDEDEFWFGWRPRPVRVPRAAIDHAEVGDVPWGRGGPVPGVVLHLCDGSVRPLGAAALLHHERRRAWADAITQWARAGERPLEYGGQVSMLRLDRDERAEVDRLLAERPDETGAVVVAQFSAGPVWTEWGLGTVSVDVGDQSIVLDHRKMSAAWLSLEADTSHDVAIQGHPDTNTWIRPVTLEAGAAAILLVRVDHRAHADRVELTMLDPGARVPDEICDGGA